jgi:hypothetical protein
MKKAKFALTAVAVLAVIGGALAFKASRNAIDWYTDTLTTTQPGGPIVKACRAHTFYASTIVDNSPLTLKGYTTTLNVECPTVKVVAIP